jgi:hypothetical protein
MTITNGEFLAYSFIILIIFAFKRQLAELIFNLFEVEVKLKVFTYLSGILLLILLVFGIFFNQGAGTLSNAFSDLEPSSNKKPMKYFDLNTNGKEIFK